MMMMWMKSICGQLRLLQINWGFLIPSILHNLQQSSIIHHRQSGHGFGVCRPSDSGILNFTLFIQPHPSPFAMAHHTQPHAICLESYPWRPDCWGVWFPGSWFFSSSPCSVLANKKSFWIHLWGGYKWNFRRLNWTVPNSVHGIFMGICAWMSIFFFWTIHQFLGHPRV